MAVDYPLTMRHRDGTLTEVLYNASVYRDVGGKVLGVFAAARDVTKQHRAQQEIAEQQAKALERLAELQKFQRLTVGRELKMIELKKEIERLQAYDNADGGGPGAKYRGNDEDPRCDRGRVHALDPGQRMSPHWMPHVRLSGRWSAPGRSDAQPSRRGTRSPQGRGPGHQPRPDTRDRHGLRGSGHSIDNRPLMTTLAVKPPARARGHPL
jgi:hypothetical protein